MASRKIIVDSSLPSEVVFNARGLAGLAQEIRTLLTTPKGTLPLDRDFGISWEMIDQPIISAMPLYVSEVATQVEKYIPRVRMESVDFRSPQTEAVCGILRPVVTCVIREEYAGDFV